MCSLSGKHAEGNLDPAMHAGGSAPDPSNNIIMQSTRPLIIVMGEEFPLSGMPAVASAMPCALAEVPTSASWQLDVSAPVAHQKGNTRWVTNSPTGILSTAHQAPRALRIMHAQWQTSSCATCHEHEPMVIVRKAAMCTNSANTACGGRRCKTM